LDGSQRAGARVVWVSSSRQEDAGAAAERGGGARAIVSFARGIDYFVEKEDWMLSADEHLKLLVCAKDSWNQLLAASLEC